MTSATARALHTGSILSHDRRDSLFRTIPRRACCTAMPGYNLTSQATMPANRP